MTTNWRSYGLSQSRGSLPSGPVTVMVHMASVWVAFSSESKEAIAHYPEIIKELTFALQDCGRRLSVYLKRRKRQMEAERKRKQEEAARLAKEEQKRKEQEALAASAAIQAELSTDIAKKMIAVCEKKWAEGEHRCYCQKYIQFAPASIQANSSCK